MDIETRMWAHSSTGNKRHGFVDGVALCRKSIRLTTPEGPGGLLDYCEAAGMFMCKNCENKFNQFIEAEEAHQRRLTSSLMASDGEGDHLPPARTARFAPVPSSNPAPMDAVRARIREGAAESAATAGAAPFIPAATDVPVPAKGSAVFKADGRWGTVLDGVVETGRRRNRPGFGRRYVSVLWTTAENGAPQPTYGFAYLDEVVRIVAAPSGRHDASETVLGLADRPMAGTRREAVSDVQRSVRAALIRNKVGLRFE